MKNQLHFVILVRYIYIYIINNVHMCFTSCFAHSRYQIGVVTLSMSLTMKKAPAATRYTSFVLYSIPPLFLSFHREYIEENRNIYCV